MARKHTWPALATALLPLAGCTLLLGDFEKKGTGGEPSSSVSSSSSGTGGGSSLISSSGTGGACSHSCSSPTECPVPMEACVEATCQAGCCGTANVPKDTMAPIGQKAGDCAVSICDGNGKATTANDDNDAPAAIDDCHEGACANGMPNQNPLAAGTICTTNGGSMCDGKGVCVECLLDTDCMAPKVCDPMNGTHTCVLPGCTDGAKNGNETDTDCGGPDCGACPNGKACAGDLDCFEGHCAGGSCAAATCNDGVKDGAPGAAETGPDCGGPCVGQGKKCADGVGCAVDLDCQYGYCDTLVSPAVCKTPTCSDGVANGKETGVDCGGPSCGACPNGQPCATAADCLSNKCAGGVCAPKALGELCGAATECGSGSCADGYCCDSACNTPCHACAAVYTGGQNGKCAAVSDNSSDPHGMCMPTANICSPTGVCQGGACQIPAHRTNVLLLVDNSGSMEYLIEPPGKLPGDPAAPGTACNGATNLVARNRWATVVTALTGSIADTDFSCQAVSRTSAGFSSEFKLGANAPYDNTSTLPFHRIYSNGCAYGAGTLPGNWAWWNLPSAVGGSDFTYRNPSGGVVASCTFNQQADGILDTFASQARFGLMTIDALPSAGTGSSATLPPATPYADYATARAGLWSYFDNWTAGIPALSESGNPNVVRPGAGNVAGGSVIAWEVGARNQAAPPWEGRLVPFGDWNSETGTAQLNAQIQMELLTTRPFGGSPLAALLDDARELLFFDTTIVPGKTYRFGPSDDQYWINGCRKTMIVLFSDGESNLEMRNAAPFGVNDEAATAVHGCESTMPSPAGVCPYDTAVNTAAQLYTSPGQSVSTLVVGVTISDFARMTPVPTVASGAQRCEDLVPATDCASPPATLQACCNLQRIAVAGGTTHAYFIDTPAKLAQLKQALGSML